MKVSGFTFVRNAVKFDYPIVEAIKSILPICDEFVIAIGNSEDDSIGLIKSIGSDKIKIIETIWDESLREGGKVLAVETNKAFDAISPDSDWAFYIQGDECFHENDLPKIKEAMLKWKDDKRVEGLVFNHINFYGTFDYYADSRKWQKKEVRVVRNDKNRRSWKDAMSFRKHGEKLHVKYVDALIYHYGWVKSPELMKRKLKNTGVFWHGDEAGFQEFLKTEDYFDYNDFDSLKKFLGKHPEVMKERVRKGNPAVQLDITRKKFSLKKRFLYWFEKKTGVRPFSFRNYRII